MTSLASPMQVGLVSGVRIADMDCNEVIDVPPVYVVKTLPFNNSPSAEDAETWPHLQHVPFYWTHEPVGLLIGQSVPEALFPIASVKGLQNEPYAVKTALGWSLQGPVRKDEEEATQLTTAWTQIQAREIDDQLERLHQLDIEGIHDFSTRSDSQDDQEWYRKVEGSIQREAKSRTDNGRYTVALPFRDGAEKRLPNNWTQAMQRMTVLLRKFQRNPQFEKDYEAFMTKMIDQNYMEKVEEQEARVVSYVIHHGVYHPQKPQKIRVVFNCASRFQGVALNDCLLSGPDLTNSLLGVLMRFRQEKVAFMADVDAMFYNVLVPEHQ